MKKAKKKERKFDFSVTGGANDQLTGELEAWESAVIKTTVYFTVCKLRGPSLDQRQVTVYRTFPEAHKVARDDRQALIYAITEEGRWCCIPYPTYPEVEKLWHDMYPDSIAAHVFMAATGDHKNEWFSYGHGITTGPWPDDLQATLVGSVILNLHPQVWKTCTVAEQNTVLRALQRLNPRLATQGRHPVEPPKETDNG